MDKFQPKCPFTLYEEGSNFGNKSKDSQLFSDLIEEHINIGGVTMNVYRFIGTFPQARDALNVEHDESGSVEDATDIFSFMGVQDTILNENRDREYDFDEIPRLKGAYTVTQNELELARFGAMLANDVLTVEFHAETVEKELGRRFIVGDVIEMPHLREVGVDGRVANRWYEVSTVVWSPTGYDPTYMRHVLGCVLKPLRNQQEFLDIFEREDEYGKTLSEQASNKDQMLAITEANQELAGEHASVTGIDTTIMYIDPERDTRPSLWTDDLKPPNGIPVKQGLEFPSNAAEGEWFVRTDLIPNRLYQLVGNKWRLRELDKKREWQPYNWVETLREFVSDGSEEDKSRPYELRSIHDVLTPRERKSDPTGDDNR